MSPLLLRALGVIPIIMAILAVMTGKVMAGSRGFQTNYYTKQDNPALYYGFICVYLLIGAFVVLNSFS